MLKYAFSFIIKNRFIQILAKNETLKRFSFKNGKTLGGSFFTQVKFRHFFEKSVTRPVCQNTNCFQKPAVLLGGILSFFGYEKKPDEPELILKIKKGILFMRRRQFDKAEVMFHIALKLAQEEEDEDGITYAYDMLANLAFERDEYDKAEKLFVHVLQRLLAMGEPPSSVKIVDVSLKLAKIFHHKKDFKKAEQGFSFCLHMLGKKLEQEEQPDEDTLGLWGLSFDWFGRFLLDLDKKEHALVCFKKAYEICVKINGIQHEQSVVLLNDLGTVSSLMGDTDSAMTYLEQAKDIGCKLPEMKDLAAIYINLGQLYLLKEMYRESKTACEQGLKLARKFNDEIAIFEANECLKSIQKVFNNSNTEKQYKLLDSQGTTFKEAQITG